MMEPTRRSWLFAAAAAAMGGARAQQVARLPVIGFLNGSSYELSANLVAAFHRGLAETGFVEGRNVVFEYRTAEGHYDKLPALAADLVARKVQLIVAAGTPTGLPAKAATASSDIPVVFVTGSDPVEQGLVASLGAPGGNLTGATTLAVQLGHKRLELLRQVVPSAKVVGLLMNPTGPNVKSVLGDLRAAAAALGVKLQIFEASSGTDLNAVFALMAQQRLRALVIGTDTYYNAQSATLGVLSRRYLIPAVYQYREFVAGGGLMSYAGSITDAYRAVGVYAGRILHGEKPASLAVQQSAKAEFYINVSTARALSVTIPQAVLIRADELID
jgi:putative ABC transport system substrate-binding protein